MVDFFGMNLDNLSLRIDSPKYCRRVLKVLRTYYNRHGLVCVVQNDVKSMEQNPSEMSINYLIKLIEDNISFPTTKEAIKMIQNGGNELLEINR